MQPFRVGVLGAGRVGRTLIRSSLSRADLQVVALADPAEADQLAYLLQFDTLLGRLPHRVRHENGWLVMGEQRLRLYAGEAAQAADWNTAGIDLLVVAPGRAMTRAELEAERDRGAPRFLLCVPLIERPDLTLIRGVNDGELRPEHNVVSIGSVTANASIPVLKVLLEVFGLERVFLTSVHAYGSHLRLADVPSDDPRGGRAAAENVIPQPTNADELIAELLPQLAGRVSGLALNVPVPNGSVVDLTCWHPHSLCAADINAAMEQAIAGPLAGILAFETEAIVSSDCLHSSHSGVFDSLSTQVVAGRISKTLTFYDNSWGYVNRALETAAKMCRLAIVEGDNQ